MVGRHKVGLGSAAMHDVGSFRRASIVIGKHKSFASSELVFVIPRVSLGNASMSEFLEQSGIVLNNRCQSAAGDGWTNTRKITGCESDAP